MRKESLSAAVQSLLVGAWRREVTSTSLSWSVLHPNAALVGLNLTNALLPLALIGLVRIRRLGQGVGIALGSIFAIHLVFFIRYDVPDLFTFSLPTLMLVAVIGAYGAAEIARRSLVVRGAVVSALVLSILLCPLIYGLAPGVLKRLGVSSERREWGGLRDEARYWLKPWKHDERSAQTYALSAMRQAAPNGVVVVTRYPIMQALWSVRAVHPGFDGVTVVPADRTEGWLAWYMEVNRGRDMFLAGPIEGYPVPPSVTAEPSGPLKKLVVSTRAAPPGS